MAEITGTSDSDNLTGTAFDDRITGFAGNDTIYASGGNDQLFGGDGDDVIFANDVVLGGAGLVRGGSGDDSVELASTSGGDLGGGDGIDVLGLIHLSSDALRVNLRTSFVDAGATAFAGLTFAGFERLRISANAGDDRIIGGNRSDQIDVASGANFVDAKGGDDEVIYQTRDANRLFGGDGADTLYASSGTSSLYFIVDSLDGSVDDGSLSTIAGFEHYSVTGAAEDDIVALGALRDVFLGWGGADTGIGGGGGDILFGGAQDDSLLGQTGRDRLYGGEGNDILFGGFGDDVIAAGPGLDSVFGGVGNDRILLYTGRDLVSGGTGADSFEFNRNEWGPHEITDFETGIDLLVFAGAFLPGTLPAGPLDPALLAYGTATGPAAQFVVTYSGLDDLTTLLWDTNGDDPAGGSYAVVTLAGQVILTASDILIV